MSSLARTPTYRGFDYFYGYYNSFIDYWTKTYDGYVDLHENEEVVTDTAALDDNYHSAFLFQEKAEKVIEDHAQNYKDHPLFLLYSLQLVHAPYSVPDIYLQRCSTGGYNDNANYCGMNIMIDEIVTNITCKLEETGMDANTIMIVASDNGGASGAMSSTNLPFRGYKYDYFRGAMSVNAFIHSPLIPDSARGTQYNGQVHVTGTLSCIELGSLIFGYV
jgi:arylsulfatase B